MNTKLVKDKIVLVKLNYLKENKSVYYREEEIKKYFFGLIKEKIEGGYFYRDCGIVAPDMVNDYIVLNNKIYNRPRIQIQMVTNKTVNYVFNSDEKMEKWFDENLKELNLTN